MVYCASDERRYPHDRFTVYRRAGPPHGVVYLYAADNSIGLENQVKPPPFTTERGEFAMSEARTWLSISHHPFSACRSGGVHIRIHGCICSNACFNREPL